MQTRTSRARGSKAAPPSPVIHPPVPEQPEPPPATPSGPLDRDDAGNVIDWSRPETLRTRSGMWVAAWLLVPLLAVLLWGWLTR